MENWMWKAWYADTERLQPIDWEGRLTMGGAVEVAGAAVGGAGAAAEVAFEADAIDCD